MSAGIDTNVPEASRLKQDVQGNISEVIDVVDCHEISNVSENVRHDAVEHPIFGQQSGDMLNGVERLRNVLKCKERRDDVEAATPVIRCFVKAEIVRLVVEEEPKKAVPVT